LIQGNRTATPLTSAVGAKATSNQRRPIGC
jgi:hypothetical protein